MFNDEKMNVLYHFSDGWKYADYPDLVVDLKRRIDGYLQRLGFKFAQYDVGKVEQALLSANFDKGFVSEVCNRLLATIPDIDYIAEQALEGAKLREKELRQRLDLVAAMVGEINVIQRQTSSALSGIEKARDAMKKMEAVFISTDADELKG